jgi:hypothetical protein
MVMRAGYVKEYGVNNGIRRPLKDFVFLADGAVPGDSSRTAPGSFLIE